MSLKFPPSFLGLPYLKKLANIAGKPGGGEREEKEAGELKDVVPTKHDISDSTLRLSVLSLGRIYTFNVDFNLKIRETTYGNDTKSVHFDNIGVAFSATHKDTPIGGNVGFNVDREGRLMQPKVSARLFCSFVILFLFPVQLARQRRKGHCRLHLWASRQHQPLLRRPQAEDFRLPLSSCVYPSSPAHSSCDTAPAP